MRAPSACIYISALERTSAQGQEKFLRESYMGPNCSWSNPFFLLPRQGGRWRWIPPLILWLNTSVSRRGAVCIRFQIALPTLGDVGIDGVGNCLSVAFFSLWGSLFGDLWRRSCPGGGGKIIMSVLEEK